MLFTLEMIILVVIMAITSMIAGLAPLVISLLQKTLTLTSLLSMGILVSTALVVVIPEGMESVYSSVQEPGMIPGVFLLLGFLLMYLLDNFLSSVKGGHSSTDDPNFESLPCSDGSESFSLLVREETSNNFFLNSFRSIYMKQPVAFPEIVKSIVTSSTTIGLVIHAIVDGILLGSSFLKMDSFHIIIFLSLIIHKIPTCFSLSTILIKERLATKIICFHIALFSLSLPIATLVTYYSLKVISLSDRSVGYLLLFSGGTFLYVVIHVIMDVAKVEENENRPESVESGRTLAGHHKDSLDWIQLGISLVGMIIPILIGLLGGEH